MAVAGRHQHPAGPQRLVVRASATGIGTSPSSQPAKPSMKVAPMCCTSSTGSGNAAGSAPSSRASAGGPPVEAATASAATPASRFGRGRVAGSWGEVGARPAADAAATGWRRRITGTWLMIASWVAMVPAAAA